MTRTRLPGFFDPDRLDNRNDRLIERLVPIVRAFEAWHRSDVRGIERVPDGAALFVGNHSAATTSIDTFLFAAALFRERGVSELPFGLAHDTAVSLPLFNQILAVLGGVRASHENARRLFEAGRKVIVYPGGDLDSLRPWRDRDRVLFGGRTGYIRLALRYGVPVVPVVAAGAQETLVVLTRGRKTARVTGVDRLLRLKVLPLIFSVPWGLTLGPPPPFVPLPSRILIEVLEPISFERRGPEASEDTEYVRECARRVEHRMQWALTRLARERRQRRRRAER